MSAEDSRGAAAGADCCRTAPQASAHEARRLRVNIVMNPVHGGIFTRRNTHSIKIKHGFPYTEEVSQAVVQSPQNIDPGGIILRDIRSVPSYRCPDILAPIFNKFGIVLRRQLRLVGKKVDGEL
jgi:hypothetical protein